MDGEEFNEHIDIDAQPWFEQWKSFAIIILDTHKSMFELDETGASPFMNCVKAIDRISEDLLLRRNSNQLAIVLHEVEEKSQLVDFKTNMIEINKLFASKAELDENELRTTFERQQDVDLATTFRLCRKKLNDLKQFRRKNLMFVTNDPNPIKSDSKKRFAALNEAKNFHDNNIHFELVVPNENFDYSQFYNELFSELNVEKVEIICKDSEGFYDKFTGRIGFKHVIQKFNFYPFMDDRTKYMSVILKTGIKSNRLLNSDRVAADGTVVKMIKKPILDPEAKNQPLEYVIKCDEPKKGFPLIRFSAQKRHEILNEIQSFPKGFTLLYVSKRLSSVGETGSTPRVIFCDPDETLKFFYDFWQYCANMNLVMICMCKLRKNEDAKYAELIPKIIDGSNAFLVKKILFADEVEYEKYAKVEESENYEEEAGIVDKLLDNFTCDFSVRHLISGEYERKKEYIKAKLLERDRREIEIKEDVFSVEEKEAKIKEFVGSAFFTEVAKKRKK